MYLPPCVFCGVRHVELISGEYSDHRRRIETEGKANAVASVGGGGDTGDLFNSLPR